MSFSPISFDRTILSRFEEVIRQEWLLSNGLGGYSSSTVLGINTRKYHGLIVSAFSPPEDRRVCLAKVDEDVTIVNNVYRLGANEFQDGTIFPRGYDLINHFALTPNPTYQYSLPDVEVQKTVFVPYKRNAVILLYRVINKTGSNIKIEAFPIVNSRSFHAVTNRFQASSAPRQAAEKRGSTVEFDSPKAAVALKAIGGRYCANEKWVEKLLYREEANRGESCIDDCYQPGLFEFDARSDKTESFTITAVAEESAEAAKSVLASLPDTLYDMNLLLEKESERFENHLGRFYAAKPTVPRNDWLSWLILAADSFLAESRNLDKWIVAGYHWFGPWGRDSFISLPGLLLVTGMFEEAKQLFATFNQHTKQGLIPNMIPETGEPIYNVVDATLWYMNSVFQFVKYTGDYRFVRQRLWSNLKLIMENHMKGTMFDIHVRDDCLLSHGPQLTWMDAISEGKPVTPRQGKAVEIQALWYNALRIMELLSRRFSDNDEADKYSKMAETAEKSFNEKFWNKDGNCLVDVVLDDDRQDKTLRPNQIVAAALDFSMLERVRAELVVDFVQKEFLTPFGLRTLSRADPRYRGAYLGDRRSRDSGYHNGAAWPWLSGQLTTAYLRTKGYTEFRREYAMNNFLARLLTKQLSSGALGTISEIYDGDPPHQARGCVSQAWSVAEPLRAYVEGVLQVRPAFESLALRTSG